MAISNEQLYVCGVKLLIGSVGTIFVVTLFPYNFSLTSELTLSGASSHALRHILLFVPFGFALACLLRKSAPKYSYNLLLILVGGICIPVLAEALQVFLPTRSASSGDMLANVVGLLLGVLVFLMLGNQLIKLGVWYGRRASEFLTLKIILATALGYLIAVCVLTASLQRTIGLETWEESFPLLIGNEGAGERPWYGHIYQLQFADRSLSEREITNAFATKGHLARIEEPVLASYRLTDRRESYPDGAGRLSELVWRGEKGRNNSNEPWFFGPGRWLATVTTAEPLSRAIKKSSQFTLSVTLASAHPEQTGPARIVSISRDHRSRNFTLGQEGTAIVVRLRTALTGKNGMNPQLMIPDVLVNDKPRHIAVTYDGTTLRAFIDGVQHPNSLELTPGAAITRYWFAVTAENMKGHKVLYYGLLFVPLGVLTGFASKALNNGSSVKYVVSGLGIILPVVIVEIVSAVLNGTGRVENLFLGLVFSTGGMLPVLWPPNAINF